MSQNTTKRHADHESDPAHTPGDGWVGEGGASHLGPATHTRLQHENTDDSEDSDSSDNDSKKDK